MSDAGTGHGFGRVLVAVYAVFALAASARSLYQLATKADEAPVAYALSALAGVVYVVATFALATDRRRLATATIGFELVGVLAVGALTLVDGEPVPRPDGVVGLRRRVRVHPARAAVRGPVVAAEHATRRLAGRLRPRALIPRGAETIESHQPHESR